MPLPVASLALCSVLLGPGDLAAGLEGPEPAPEAEPADAGEVADTSEVAAPSSASKREWMLVISPAFDYVIGFKNAFRALGGGLRFGGHAVSWIGKKGHFLVGGGPIIHYSYLSDEVNADVLHLVTVNGDLILGGGNKRWGVYWHLTTGFGYLGASDGATGTKLHLPGVRAATGIGGFAKIVDRFSLGALVDFGYAGGIWINPMITANIHFGRKGDPL